MEEVVGSVGSGLVGLHMTGELLGTSVALLRTGSLGGTVSPWSLRTQMSGHQEYSKQANTVNVGTRRPVHSKWEMPFLPISTSTLWGLALCLFLAVGLPFPAGL